ncbi:hypothetical protein IJJ27_00570 [bacterium]|nr:hypothetical protein [bacterium]
MLTQFQNIYKNVSGDAIKDILTKCLSVDDCDNQIKQYQTIFEKLTTENQDTPTNVLSKIAVETVNLPETAQNEVNKYTETITELSKRFPSAPQLALNEIAKTYRGRLSEALTAVGTTSNIAGAIQEYYKISDTAAQIVAANNLTDLSKGLHEAQLISERASGYMDLLGVDNNAGQILAALDAVGDISRTKSSGENSLANLINTAQSTGLTKDASGVVAALNVFTPEKTASQARQVLNTALLVEQVGADENGVESLISREIAETIGAINLGKARDAVADAKDYLDVLEHLQQNYGKVVSGETLEKMAISNLGNVDGAVAEVAQLMSPTGLDFGELISETRTNINDIVPAETLDSLIKELSDMDNLGTLSGDFSRLGDLSSLAKNDLSNVNVAQLVGDAKLGTLVDMGDLNGLLGDTSLNELQSKLVNVNINDISLNSLGKEISNLGLEQIKLSDVNLSSLGLNEADFQGVDLSKINLGNLSDLAQLKNLSSADLSKLNDLDLSQLNKLSQIDLKNINLSDLDLSKVNIDLKNIDLSKVDLASLASLKNLNLDNLDATSLQKLGINGLGGMSVDQLKKLAQIDLRDIDLKNIDLSKMKIDLSGINLNNVDLKSLVDLKNVGLDKIALNGLQNIGVNALKNLTNLSNISVGSLLSNVSLKNINLGGLASIVSRQGITSLGGLLSNLSAGSLGSVGSAISSAGVQSLSGLGGALSSLSGGASLGSLSSAGGIIGGALGGFGSGAQPTAYIKNNLKAVSSYDAKALAMHLIYEGNEVYPVDYSLFHPQYLNAIHATNLVDFSAAKTPLLRNVNYKSERLNSAETYYGYGAKPGLNEQKDFAVESAWITKTANSVKCTIKVSNLLYIYNTCSKLKEQSCGLLYLGPDLKPNIPNSSYTIKKLSDEVAAKVTDQEKDKSEFCGKLYKIDAAVTSEAQIDNNNKLTSEEKQLRKMRLAIENMEFYLNEYRTAYLVQVNRICPVRSPGQCSVPVYKFPLGAYACNWATATDQVRIFPFKIPELFTNKNLCDKNNKQYPYVCSEPKTFTYANMLTEYYDPGLVQANFLSTGINQKKDREKINKQRTAYSNAAASVTVSGDPSQTINCENCSADKLSEALVRLINARKSGPNTPTESESGAAPLTSNEVYTSAFNEVEQNNAAKVTRTYADMCALKHRGIFFAQARISYWVVIPMGQESERIAQTVLGDMVTSREYKNFMKNDNRQARSLQIDGTSSLLGGIPIVFPGGSPISNIFIQQQTLYPSDKEIYQNFANCGSISDYFGSRCASSGSNNAASTPVNSGESSGSDDSTRGEGGDDTSSSGES